MTLRSLRREEFYQDMLEDAETAVRYWGRTEPLERRVLIGSWRVWEIGSGNEPLGSAHVVTVDVIARGWRKLLALEATGGFDHPDGAGTVRAVERSLTSGDGREDYDAGVADTVVQLAVFGEIRYR